MAAYTLDHATQVEVYDDTGRQQSLVAVAVEGALDRLKVPVSPAERYIVKWPDDKALLDPHILK